MDDRLSKKQYSKNVVLNYIFKFLSIFFGLYVVNVNLSFLGSDLYGLWATIASTVSWMNYGDFGISNGLRNALAEAVGQGDVKRQNRLLATAVVTLTKVAGILFIASLFIFEVLFATNILAVELRLPVIITTFFFCINFVLGIGRTIAYSYQESWLATLAQCNTVIMLIITLVALMGMKVQANLVIYAIVNGVTALLANVVILVILIRKKILVFSGNIKEQYDDKELKAILHVGLTFFALQLCSLILYSTDNIIINKLFGSEFVTQYSIITKVFDTGNNLFNVVLVSLWSGVTYALAQNNLKWVKQQIKKVLLFWSLFACGVVAVMVGFDILLSVWLGNKAPAYSTAMILVFGIYCLVTSFSSIFVSVGNGMGHIKIQLIVSIVGAVLNIPLSIFLATTCSMGILGVKVATLISCVITAILVPIDVMAALKHKTN